MPTGTLRLSTGAEENKFRRTVRFKKWFAALTDDRDQGRIDARISMAEAGSSVAA